MFTENLAGTRQVSFVADTLEDRQSPRVTVASRLPGETDVNKRLVLTSWKARAAVQV